MNCKRFVNYVERKVICQILLIVWINTVAWSENHGLQQISDIFWNLVGDLVEIYSQISNFQQNVLQKFEECE